MKEASLFPWILESPRLHKHNSDDQKTKIKARAGSDARVKSSRAMEKLIKHDGVYGSADCSSLAPAEYNIIGLMT